MIHQTANREIIYAIVRDSVETASTRLRYASTLEKQFSETSPVTAFLPPWIPQIFHLHHIVTLALEMAVRKIAVIACRENFGISVEERKIQGVIKTGRLRRIAEMQNRLASRDKSKRYEPNWKQELAYILRGRGEDIPVTVVCDVYAENLQTGERFAFELKAPLPNNDQTKVSKEKIFKLYCMEPRPVEGAYYALPYNPYGRKEDYAWSFPAQWFNMKEDEVVLIGDEFWEKIGGLGTYQAFIEAVNEIGAEYKEQIYREYLGIEPPPGSLDISL
ncbi:MAG: TdeIII family type II restriction endonuclease [Chloroflexi bacterium]|nr:TdeIII family type II restriction endonuclease [Chloroflexota bacterium]